MIRYQSSRTVRPVSIVLFLALLVASATAYSDEARIVAIEADDLLAAGNYSAAAAAYDRALAIEPADHVLWDRKADALNRNGAFDEALAASKKALDINPDYVTGWINRGQILYNLGYYYEDVVKDPKKADELYTGQLAAFETATRLDPDNADAWFNRGYALAGLKRYDEAIAAFDKTATLDPAYPNLAMCKKQAVVLRDASLPVQERYAVPIAVALLIILCGAGICLVYRHHTIHESESARENIKKTGKRPR